MFGRRARAQRRATDPRHTVPPPIVTAVLGDALSVTAHGNRTNWVPTATNPMTDPVSRSGLIRQFACWYDSQPSNSRVLLARRTRPEGELTNWSAWTTQAASITNSGAVADAHFNVSMGVRATGIPVVTWRAHNLDTAFRWIGDDADDLTIDANDAVLTTEGIENTSTYWRWLYQGDGELFASFRVGAAGGNAQQVIIRDNGTNFTLLHSGHTPPGFVDWPGGGGDQESPYFYRPSRNTVTGRWHWAWTWARAGNILAYHDVHYLYSDDDNDTFHYADGTDATLPVGSAASHPESVAWSAPEGLIRSVGHCTTTMADDQPVIAYAAVDDVDSTQTNIYVLTRYQGQWVRRTVYRQLGWVNTDPPATLEVSNVMCLHKNGSTFVWYGNNFLGSGLWVQVSRDKALSRWSAPVRLIDVARDYGISVLDDSAWQHFGEIYEQIRDANQSAAVSPGHLARVAERLTKAR